MKLIKELRLVEDEIELLRMLALKAKLRSDSEVYVAYFSAILSALPAADDIRYLKYGEASIKLSRKAARAAEELLNNRKNAIQNVTLPELERRLEDPAYPLDPKPQIKKLKLELQKIENLMYNIMRSIK